MGKNNKQSRNTIRRPYRDMQEISNKGIFLYGKLMKKSRARGWCNLHNCYLTSDDIREKRCKIKKCKNLNIRGQNDGVI